jgi:hypothetical protein
MNRCHNTMTNWIKQLLGIQTPVSLLALSLWHYNTSTWLERITANGIIEDYIVKR